MNPRLVVIGDGPDRKRLESLAGKNTEFLGRQPDDVVTKYASRCRALLFPGEEDFGMVPLEINAAGRPVIAFGRGGATETVVSGQTGIFFQKQTVESLIEAIEEFETLPWNRQTIRRHAEKFDTVVFIERLNNFMQKVAPASCVSEIKKSRTHSPFVIPEQVVRQTNEIIGI
ncbi:MAG: glycosyltransferase [Pyrinomonadaceae bacterium]